MSARTARHRYSTGVQLAGGTYGMYECDHCKHPISAVGYITLGRLDSGVLVPLSACCHTCRSDGKRL